MDRFLRPVGDDGIHGAITSAWATGTGAFESHLMVDGRDSWLSFAAEVTELEGEPVLLLVVRDVTERHRADEQRRRLETQVQHAQRMESLGVLAGGIAHDFNNLLVGILGNASLAMMDVREGQAADSLRQIELAARRAAELTGQVLTFAGRAQPTAEALDLGAMIREMSGLLEPAISRRARLVYEIDRDLPAIHGDPAQLRQVVMNLIMNASDALQGEEGEVAIRLRASEVGDDFEGGGWLGDVPDPGACIELAVTDTGCGMDASTRRRIFEPFFTTKFTGRGLGLAATLGIVHAHDGLLRVDSEVGEGTTISILLPAGRGPVREPVPSEPEDGTPPASTDTGRDEPVRKVAGPSIRILVVDDEPAVLRLATMVLERQGMSVVAAENGQQALELHAADPGPFDVALVDMSMPGMDGIELVRRFRERGDEVPALLSSGYDRGTIEEQLREVGGHWAVLSKPYRPADLVREVDALLRSTAGAGI